jgi:uncharacterized lipoprotein YmbA
MKHVFLVCVTVLYLSACATSSVQIQHLQLSSGTVATPGGDSPVIILDAIALPDYLLRDELLRRDSDYLLHYDGLRRWSEPLDLGIQRVLAQRLRGALNTRQIMQFPRVPSVPAQWMLRISLTHFEAQGDRIILSAEGQWEQVGSDSANAASVVFEDSLPLDTSSAESTARGMSQLLWRLADDLANSFTTTLRQTSQADFSPLKKEPSAL